MKLKKITMMCTALLTLGVLASCGTISTTTEDEKTSENTTTEAPTTSKIPDVCLVDGEKSFVTTSEGVFNTLAVGGAIDIGKDYLLGIYLNGSEGCTDFKVEIGDESVISVFKKEDNKYYIRGLKFGKTTLIIKDLTNTAKPLSTDVKVSGALTASNVMKYLSSYEWDMWDVYSGEDLYMSFTETTGLLHGKVFDKILEVELPLDLTAISRIEIAGDGFIKIPFTKPIGYGEGESSTTMAFLAVMENGGLINSYTVGQNLHGVFAETEKK